VAENGQELAEPGLDLSPQQRRAAEALAGSARCTVREAAEASRSGERTVWRWLNDRRFRAYLEHLLRQMDAACHRKIIAARLHAVAVADELADDEDPHVRLGAIREIRQF